MSHSAVYMSYLLSKREPIRAGTPSDTTIDSIHMDAWRRLATYIENKNRKSL